MFFEVLVSLLGKNGVAIHDVNVTETCWGKIDIDFSEHDKVFEDKIASLEENVGYYKDSLSRVEKNCDKLYHENKELKQRIAELESKSGLDMPYDVLEATRYIINAKSTSKLSEEDKKILGADYLVEHIFSVDDLKQIAEHLLIYCKHNKECEE